METGPIRGFLEGALRMQRVGFGLSPLRKHGSRNEYIGACLSNPRDRLCTNVNV